MERTAITGTAARTLKEACTKKKLFQRQSSPRLECVCVHTRPAQVCIYVYTLEATEPKAMRATDDMSQIQRVETSPGLFVLGIKFGPSKKMGDISSSKLGGGNSDRGKIALRKLLIPQLASIRSKANAIFYCIYSFEALSNDNNISHTTLAIVAEMYFKIYANCC